jgi:tetratricopeptide (TPR) repeat protein
MAGFQSILFRPIVPGALIIFATLLAYLPALSNGFIWNDSDYVTAPAMRSLGGLARIWAEPGATEQYYPLLHSAFWVQHRLWGDHPLGYHLVTLLLHAGSALLFGLILRRLFASDGARPSAGVAWLAALLFALHPVHVESVAWITEQKNTLSLAFYLISALIYLRFDETRRPQTYAAALALFVASLGCKTVTATLPAALLVVLWWKRGQLGWRRDILPLLPWLALGAVAGLFSSWVEQSFGGAEGVDFNLPAIGRMLVAGRAIWFYAGNLVWPFGLNFIYPRWTVDVGVWWQWLFPLGVLAVGAALWALRRRTRGPLAAFLLFVGSLFPALGFVNLYGARYSWVWDHWQYLPDLGPLALVAAGLTAGWRRAALRLGWLGPGLVAALAVLLGALTWAHCRMFHDDETLYRTTLARNPSCWMAHYNLGVAWSQMPGRLNDAIAQYEAALRLKPDHAKAHYNLGVAWSQMPGRLSDAIAEYEAALRLRPDYAEAHNNLGLAWAQMPGRLNDAIGQYQAALRLQPDSAEVHINLGNAWSKMPGRLNDAIAQYEAALRLQPDSAEAHNNLGDAWLKMPGRLNDAIAEYEAALRLRPDFAQAHDNLGVAWAHKSGRLNDAVAEFEAALRLQPNYAEAHNNLGLAWEQMPGRLNDAVAQFEEALRLQPDSAETHYNLGNAWSKMPGRLNDAVAQYEAALRLRPDYAPGWHNLGASWFQLGNLPAAAAAFREELRLSPNDPAAQQALATVLRQAEDH